MYARMPRGGAVLGGRRMSVIAGTNVDFDPKSERFIQDPYPLLHELMQKDPLHYSDHLQGWVVTRYEDVRALLADQENLSADRLRSGLDYLENKAPTEEDKQVFRELKHTFQSWVVFNDPPDHTRLRKLMDKGFKKRVIQNLRPAIELAAKDLLDEAIKRTVGPDGKTGKMELMREYANPVPARVIADMLGVPHKDMPRLVELSNDIASFVLVARNTPDKYKNAARSLRELRTYFSGLIDSAKAAMPDTPDPEVKENVLNTLIRASEDGESLSVDELIATSILLIFAGRFYLVLFFLSDPLPPIRRVAHPTVSPCCNTGHETTTHLIASTQYSFIKHPSQREKMKANLEDNTLLRNCIDEVLRYDGPSLANVRVARHDFELMGKNIKKGDRLFLFSCSANHDPSMFDGPDDFDIERKKARRHLTFGYGKHFCIGGPLAKLEGEIVTAELLRRFKSIKLDESAPGLAKYVHEDGREQPQPPFIDLIITRGMQQLPIVYELDE